MIRKVKEYGDDALAVLAHGNMAGCRKLDDIANAEGAKPTTLDWKSTPPPGPGATRPPVNPRIDRELLELYREEVIVLSGCLGGELAQYLERGAEAAARAAIERIHVGRQ